MFIGVGAITLGVVAAVLGALLTHAEHEVLASSEQLRRAAADRAEAGVKLALGTAETALGSLERVSQSGAVDVDDTRALETQLFTLLLNSPRLSEVTFTRAVLLGYDGDGRPRLAPERRQQVSVFRSEGRLYSRINTAEEGEYRVLERVIADGARFLDDSKARSWSGSDPTAHLTFSVLASRENRGRALWSDLHYSEFSGGAGDRRVVLSIQKAVSSVRGFLGVARVAITTSDLDQIARMRVETGTASDPHRVVLFSHAEGAGPSRLLARIDPRDRLVELEDELRFESTHEPPEVNALLRSRESRSDAPASFGLRVRGELFLVTLKQLALGGGGTKGWMVAVLVPESHYTRGLRQFEYGLLGWFALALGLVLLIVCAAFWAIARGLRRISRSAARMRSFDFSAEAPDSHIVELANAMQGLERAKTVGRAMSKYVPVDLVKQLYLKNEGPALGGELGELTLMFTDIEGFTALAERLPPQELSERLGSYLETITDCVESQAGTIDKYIGDAVMAFWNAPLPLAEHAKHACEAVLRSRLALDRLYTSDAWKGLPRLVTRFGVHTGRAMIGHFGAPSRFSYTALGDDVNLAARLEPLCKQYGVEVLVSASVRDACQDQFRFRHVDRVAVKGKTRPVDVYELRGHASELAEPFIQRYERALAAYFEQDFERALELLDGQKYDAPSARLFERCERLRREPRRSAWDGVYVAVSK